MARTQCPPFVPILGESCTSYNPQQPSNEMRKVNQSIECPQPPSSQRVGNRGLVSLAVGLGCRHVRRRPPHPRGVSSLRPRSWPRGRHLRDGESGRGLPGRARRPLPADGQLARSVGVCAGRGALRPDGRGSSSRGRPQGLRRGPSGHGGRELRQVLQVQVAHLRSGPDPPARDIAEEHPVGPLHAALRVQHESERGHRPSEPHHRLPALGRHPRSGGQVLAACGRRHQEDPAVAPEERQTALPVRQHHPLPATDPRHRR